MITVPRLVYVDDLMGLRDVAKLAGVSDQTAANWRVRYKASDHPFPAPITTISDGTPIFHRADVLVWLRRNKPQHLTTT